MNKTRHRLLAFASITAFYLANVTAASEPDRAAHFRVTEEVVAEDPAPVGINVTGNSHNKNHFFKHPAMEPRLFNTMISASGGDDSHIQLSPTRDMTDGYWEGAHAKVLREIGDKFELLREGRISKHRSTGWYPAYNSRQRHNHVELIVESDLDSVQGARAFYPPPALDMLPVWYRVTAVDAAGNESPGIVLFGGHRKVAENAGKLNQTLRKGNDEKKIKIDGSNNDSEAPLDPMNLRVEEPEPALHHIRWDASPSKDVVGYRVYTSLTDPATHTGFGLDFENPGPAVEKDDIVFLNVERPDYPRKSLQRVWRWWEWYKTDWKIQNYSKFPGAELVFDVENPPFWCDQVPHENGLPTAFAEDDPGLQCLHMGTTENESFSAFSGGIVSNPNNPPAQPPAFGTEAFVKGHPYRFEAWIKPVGVAKVTFEITAYAPPLNKTFELKEGEWQKVVWDFVPDRYPKAPHGVFRVQFPGPGSIYLDNIALHEANVDGPGWPITATNMEEDLDAFVTDGCVIRWWSGQSNVGDAPDLERYIAKEKMMDRNASGFLLPRLLELTGKYGGEPWLIVTTAFTDEDWRGLIEYLAAPYDRTTDGDPAIKKPGDEKYWAARRVLAGREDPWTDKFRIYIEVGNELWNGLFKPWNIWGPERMGKLAGYCQRQMASSPYYNPEKIKFLTGNCPIGNLKMYTKPVEYTPLAYSSGGRGGYVDGWKLITAPKDADPTDPDVINEHLIYYNLFIGDKKKSSKELTEYDATDRERLGFKYHTYEFSSGYNHRTQGEPHSEVVGKSLLAGTGLLDSVLYKVPQHYFTQSYFYWQSGKSWSSHTYLSQGAHLNSNTITLMMLNEHAKGDMVAVEAESVPTLDVPAFGNPGFKDSLTEVKNLGPIDDMPLVSCYAYRDGNRWTLFVLSLKTKGKAFGEKGRPMAEVDFGDGSTPVTIELPFKTIDPDRSQFIALTGEPWDTNITEEVLKPRDYPLPPVENGKLTFSLPAASTCVFVLEAK